MSNQSFLISHAETILQNVIGLLIGFIILHCYGIESSLSFKLQLTFFIFAYIRSYLIRRLFNRIK